MSGRKKLPENPVLYIHCGVEIRKINKLTIDLGEMEMVRLVNAQVASGNVLSRAQILALQGRPCQNCGHENVCIPIQKNILSINKQNSGQKKLANTDGQ
jgi:hypothetical protein